MRRYDREYNDLASPRNALRRGGNLDPNFRGGQYQGLRTGGQSYDRAAYGLYRQRHADDLGDYGGYRGVYGTGETRFLGGPAGHGQELLYNGEMESGYGSYRSPSRGYDRELRGYDRGYRPRAGGSRYDAGYRRPEGRGGEFRSRGGPDRNREEQRSNESLGASRALRRDDGFNRYGGYNTGGFSEG